MKKLSLLFIVFLLMNGCKQDDLKARSGEFCFVVDGERIEVNNDTKKTVHYDITDIESPDLMNRSAYDCNNYFILEPGKSTSHDLSTFSKEGKKALRATWWICENNLITDTTFADLQTNQHSLLCAKISD